MSTFEIDLIELTLPLPSIHNDRARDVAVLLLGQLAKEDTQWSGVLVQMLGRLHQQPARMTVAALGDRSVIAGVGRLVAWTPGSVISKRTRSCR
jgi:hypothetical protein